MARMNRARVDQLNERRLTPLHPCVIQHAKVLIEKVESSLDLVLFVISGLRTFGEQTKLYAQGRTAPGPRVTRARAGQSYHNYGLAVDVIPLRRLTPKTFELTWGDEQFLTPAYRRIRGIARTIGFETIRNDRPHLQWRNHWHWSQLLEAGFGQSRPITEIDLPDW